MLIDIEFKMKIPIQKNWINGDYLLKISLRGTLPTEYKVTKHVAL